MIQKKLTRQDLLFHPVHGLCRIDEITKQDRAGTGVLCYSLVPKVKTPMQVRFVIAAPDMEASGFHKVISAKTAHKILRYLKTGDNLPHTTDQTWALAQNIRSFSKDKMKMKDQRKRQRLEVSVKGLVAELAWTFKTPLKATAQRIQKNMDSNSRRNPLVLAAFSHAAES